MKDILSSRAKY